MMDLHDDRSNKRRYAWEFLYLLGLYFQFISTSAVLLINEAFFNNDASLVHFRNTVIAFISLATIFAYFTIAFSLFCKTRKLAIPALFFNTLFFMVALAVFTDLQLNQLANPIPINTFWQVPIGWAGFAIQVVCCLSAKRFWDANASEDSYSMTGFLGQIPVFALSRSTLFVASFFQMMGTLGFILPWVTGQMVHWQIPANDVGKFQGFLIFSAIGAVTSFVLSCASWMNPHKGRMFILTILAGLVALGQAIYLSALVNGQFIAPLAAGFNLDSGRGLWMSWVGFAFYAVSLVFTTLRSD